MNRTASNSEAELTVVGIDIGKDIFHLVGLDANGKIAFRRKIRHLALEETERLFRRPHAAQAWPRAPHHPGEVRQAFREGPEEHYNDAEAIAEAALRPNLRVVREKTQADYERRCPVGTAIRRTDASRSIR